MKNKMYRFKNLSKFENVIHGISIVADGSMKNVDKSINRVNLDKFLTKLAVNVDAVCMEQIHGANITTINTIRPYLIDSTDGLITAEKNIPQCIMTADCLPILFYDSEKKIIGAAHAGSKGLLKGVIENMLMGFKKEFGSDLCNIVVGVGPGIEKQCYEVGAEIIEQFIKRFSDFKDFYSRQNGKYFLDIRSVANQTLEALGVLSTNIEHMEICTKCNQDVFYSYRGGDGYKRFASVISLV